MRSSDYDALVIGSGAAGLSAAVAAAAKGLKVIVAECDAGIGGTTAMSEGMVWIPCSREARSLGLQDDLEAALTYLKHACGRHLDEARARAYLQAGPEVLDWFTSLGAANFYVATGSIDYFAEAPGAQLGRRSLCPQSLNGRELGPLFGRIRPPLASSLLFGGMTVASSDYPDFLRVFRSARSTLRVSRLTLAYLFDRLTGAKRGYRIANGQALIARLLKAAIEQGVEIRTSTSAVALNIESGRVVAARIRSAHGEERVNVRAGIVLASGGITGDPILASNFLNDLSAGQPHLRLVAPGVDGTGWKLGRAAGGATQTDLSDPCAWVPASELPIANGMTENFPHFTERAKPGVIAVDSKGKRFANEADIYHYFIRALINHSAGEPVAEAWLIADHTAVRRYGLGAAPPWPARLKPFLKTGYLTSASSLGKLAEALKIPPKSLEETVSTFNSSAASGVDPEFGRGDSMINRHYGDASRLPNSSLGPLTRAPFYAVRIQPSDIGGFVGLRTDSCARVLDEHSNPIPGLFAAGNDAASLFGGAYPAGGSTIGPAIVFGAIAGIELSKALNNSKLSDSGQDTEKSHELSIDASP